MNRTVQYLNAQELAKTFGVSVSSVYRAAEQGDIPSVKFGGSLRFDPEEVARALRERRNRGFPARTDGLRYA